MSTSKPDLTRVWAAGSPGNVVDPDVTPGGGKFNAGWVAEKPSFKNMNFLQQLFSQGLAYINEQGLGVWDTNTTYPVGGIAKGSDGNSYVAVLEQAGNDPVSDDGTNWVLWYTSYSDVKSGRKNLIINGNFDFWQRGDALTLPGSSAEYVADRWANARNTQTTDVNRIEFTIGQTDVPNEPKNYLRITKFGAETASSVPLEQRVEGVRTAAGKSVTLSFWAKCDSVKTFQVQINQNFGSGGSPAVLGITENISVSTSWSKFVVSGVLPSISGKTIGSSSYLVVALLEAIAFSTFTLEVAQFQLELGSVATEFEYRSPGEELALCQRYAFVPTLNSSFLFGAKKLNAIGSGAVTQSSFMVSLDYPLMRTVPSILNIVASDVTLHNESGGLITTCTSVPALSASSGVNELSCSFNSADVTDVTQIRVANSPMFFDAEL